MIDICLQSKPDADTPTIREAEYPSNTRSSKANRDGVRHHHQAKLASVAMAMKSFSSDFLQKAFVGTFKEGVMFPNKRKDGTLTCSCATQREIPAAESDMPATQPDIPAAESDISKSFKASNVRRTTQCAWSRQDQLCPHS